MKNIGHSFLVNGLTKEWRFDTFINVQKRRESILYRSSSNTRNVNLSYLQGQKINSQQNLSVRDRSIVLPENRILANNIDQVITESAGFNIETEEFLVTDIFVDAIGNLPPLPLFYQHELNINLLASESIVNIEVVDNNFNPVNVIELKFDIENQIVYNNLINSFDSISGLHDLHYATCLVRNNLTGVSTRYTQILNNKPVFTSAELSDLDELGNVIPGRKVFILQEDIGFNFSVTLPESDTYGIRRLADRRLQVLAPLPTEVENPWFVSVQNSKFVSLVETSPGNNSIFKYRIAEFLSQGFFPFFPYKQINENSIRVNRRTIKTTKNQIVIDNDNQLHIDVFVYNKDGAPKFALTSDPTKIGTGTFIGGFDYSNVLLGDPTTGGTEVNDVNTPIAGSSIDSLNGFIVLPAGFEVKENDTIETFCFYIEDKYEISFLDLNPLSRSDIINQRLVIFAKPEPLGATLPQTIFYLLINEDGRVIDSNYNIDGVEGALENGYEAQAAIEAEQMWYDLVLDNNGNPVFPSFAPSGSFDFIQTSTVEGDYNTEGFLILGEVYVRETSAPESITINDVRIRGGGIPEENTQDALEIQPEAMWNWDIGMWDGYPYPGAASYFVEVPVDILESCGGDFTPSNVEGIIHRHTALGVYPVIHRYNIYEPKITDVNVTVSGTLLSWTQHPSDSIFDIYESQFQTGPWNLVASGLANEPLGNEHNINIPLGTNRFVLVTGRKSEDGPICFSGPLHL